MRNNVHRPISGKILVAGMTQLYAIKAFYRCIEENVIMFAESHYKDLSEIYIYINDYFRKKLCFSKSDLYTLYRVKFLT